jgi:hypothetical protein
MDIIESYQGVAEKPEQRDIAVNEFAKFYFTNIKSRLGLNE